MTRTEARVLERRVWATCSDAGSGHTDNSTRLDALLIEPDDIPVSETRNPPVFNHWMQSLSHRFFTGGAACSRASSKP